jgi:5-formyltetrahydrofolate cyclo-ligase
MMNKGDLRKNLMAQRLAMDPRDWRQKSERLCQELFVWLKGHPDFDKIALFRSFRQEPDLQYFEAVWDQRQLYYPKTEADGRMDFFPHPGVFVKGRYGIEEPDGTGKALVPDARTLILVPGLAYDPNGYRLGYGGGYYDRYFHRLPCSRIGLCFAEFLLPGLPSEAHDQRVSQVLTERGIC